MDQRKTPLYDALLQHEKKQPISFHVPGHKNGLIFNEHHMFNEISKYDVTELSGLDDLHAAEGVIFQAELLLANLYKVKRSFFLINGSTVGNLAMILSSFREGDCVLVQKNSHKSIMNGLILAGVKPIFISPEYDEDMQTAGGILVDDIINALDQFQNIKGIILTYPNYYGKTYNLKQIIQIAHKKQIPVLVDEAHGPHFILGEPFPPSAVSLGADIVVHSAHKILPAMTMGSFLHFNSELLNIDRLISFLQILQSSSPSYPIMASLDLARSYLATFNSYDKGYTIKEVSGFVHQLKQLSPLTVIEDQSKDPLKITIRHPNITGFTLQRYLEEEGIYPELADIQNVLLIAPLLKNKQNYPFDDTIEKIKVVLTKINSTEHSIHSLNNSIKNINEKFSIIKYSYKELSKMDSYWVLISESIGKIAADSIIPYPPGIPYILLGEEITEKKVEILEVLIKEGYRFHGGIKIKEKKIKVFNS
jgi:arginine/lysine/ornithine decarboxylase